MKVTVYANCQAAPVLNMLMTACPTLDGIRLPAVHTLGQKDEEDVLQAIGECDIVIHQPIGANFGPFSTHSLRERFPSKKFISFPSIYFGGLSPQLCYLRDLSHKIIKGPLTDYHDTRILDGFLRGISEEECLQNIDANSQGSLDYYTKALEMSRARDVGVDIPIMDVIERELETNPPLYTFNHPTNTVLWALVIRIIEKLDLKRDKSVKMRIKPYLNNCVAAVPDAIPRRLGVTWRRPTYEVFGKAYDDRTLIQEFYQLYRKQDNFIALCRANAARFNMPVYIPATDDIPQPVANPREFARKSEHLQFIAKPRKKTMQVSSLISDWRVSCFSDILPFYIQLEPSLQVCVDGGAGLGETAKKIFEGLNGHEASIVAYEPNPANVSKFIYKNADVHLEEAALGAENGTAQFLVTATTTESKKENFLEKDTSFVGKLATDGDTAVLGDRYDVKVVRLDESLRKLGHSGADFIKLDLQGGELSALRGLGDMIGTVHWMWVEYGGQDGLLEFLLEKGFVLFDTEYLFVGRPNHLIEELFDITNVGQNSIGKQIFFGHRKHIWSDYETGFSFSQRRRRMVQTDLIAVAPGKLASFLTAAQSAAGVHNMSDRYSIPRQLF